jgi:hypothetical protein
MPILFIDMVVVFFLKKDIIYAFIVKQIQKKHFFEWNFIQKNLISKWS